jgi:hypothetical protein
MTSTRIIGLYSPAPQSGKTAVAGILSERGMASIPFAGTLKDMIVPMLTALGYDYPRAWELVLRDKGYVLPEIGVSVRHMLQTLGTEYGRQCLHPDVWLTCWRKKAERFGSVITDDVRFPNEADLIRKLGGELWLVRRIGVQRSTGHSSEGSLDDYDFDRVIDNDGTLDELRSKVMAALL